MRRTAAETREHVLSVAHELFYWHGIRAVGIDRVAAEAGIAPTTLYRIFANKDELVAAYVIRAHALSMDWFVEAVGKAGPDARDQIDAAFEAMLSHLEPEQFRGCVCMMTLAEFPDADLPAHQESVSAKAWIREQLGQLTKRLDGVADPAALADQLMLVWEGTNATAQALGLTGPAQQARALADVAIQVATGGSSDRVGAWNKSAWDNQD